MTVMTVMRMYAIDSSQFKVATSVVLMLLTASFAIDTVCTPLLHRNDLLNTYGSILPLPVISYSLMVAAS